MDACQSACNMEYDLSSVVTECSEPRKKKQIRATTTWHLKPKVTNFADWISKFDLGPPELYEPRPDALDRGPVPNHPVWRENVFVLTWMLAPLAVQWALLHFTNLKLESLLAVGIQYAMYQSWFITFALKNVTRAHYYMGKYGTLNEQKRGRDIVPDVHYKRVHYAIMAFVFIRNIGVFALGKDSSMKPHLSLWSPIKVGAFQIVLDYFFYCYHRATHEFDALWFIHRQHHATKSPTPFMSLWADDYQDLIEWIIVPFLAYQVIHLSFAELYIASGYTLYVEAIGHSGIRAYWAHPILGHVLRPFGMELAVEDHDLHHRYGRGGRNYGKQTRIWDVLFGTVAPREEEAIYALSVGLKEV